MLIGVPSNVPKMPNEVTLGEVRHGGQCHRQSCPSATARLLTREWVCGPRWLLIRFYCCWHLLAAFRFRLRRVHGSQPHTRA
jgi:hypothetical protein